VKAQVWSFFVWKSVSVLLQREHVRHSPPLCDAVACHRQTAWSTAMVSDDLEVGGFVSCRLAAIMCINSQFSAEE
jgi:hypothetical protein